MAKFNPSIVDYLGKLDIGVLVLIGIVYSGEYYEATFFYTQEQMVLTVQEELEAKLGHKITEDPEYADLLTNILKRVVPFNEMYNRIDEVDFSKWAKALEPEEFKQDEVEYLDDIKEEDQNKSSSS